MNNSELKNFLSELSCNNGKQMISKIGEKSNYDADYMSKVFRGHFMKSPRDFLNYCRVIKALHEYINGGNIILIRKKYFYSKNAFQKALRKLGFPTISKIKGNESQKVKIERRYGEIELIKKLSSETQPIKEKELDYLSQYIKGIRNEYHICSKPGPNGGFFISVNSKDRNQCIVWINNWRRSMSKLGEFTLDNPS